MSDLNPKLSIERVWDNKTDKLIIEIMSTWKEYKVLPRQVDAYARAQQVVLVVRNESDKIVGLTTAERVSSKLLRNEMYAIRGMIIPNYRIPGLFIKMTIITINALEDYNRNLKEDNKPIGVLAELEDPRLKKARLTKLASGMTLLGFSKQNLPLYVHFFKGATY